MSSLPPPPKQLEEFQNLIEEVHSKSAEAKAIIDSLNKKVGNADFETKDGLSFLELKNHVMLDYMANLTYVMLRKCSGKSINGEKAIERICEDRTVLEKMKPTEKKLRYQIDKALKIAESGQMSSNDPLNFRPNLSALKNEGSDDDDEADSDEESGDEGKIFENLDLFPQDILNCNIYCMKWQQIRISFRASMKLVTQPMLQRRPNCTELRSMDSYTQIRWMIFFSHPLGGKG